MATTSSKSTTTRKTSAKTSGTSARDDDNPDTTPTGATDTSAATSSGEQPAADDPAAALKAKMRTTQHVADAKPDELSDEQRHNLLGAPAGALPGPRTLSSPTSPTRRGEEYVTAESDGYVAWVPKYTNQPATVRVWVAGQRVRKDVHDALSGVVATSATEARVLTGDEYAQVAAHL